MLQTILSGLISGGLLMILGTALAKLAYKNIMDRLEAHDRCINSLFDRMSINEKDIARLQGRSNGK